jgi:hypothetical protein
LGALLAKLSKSTTKQLALIIIPTVGLHSGVAGTDAAANKIDDNKMYSPIMKNESKPTKL